ncbi:hypothetical protein ARMSODRAFT_983522 [Armillaria solidipes]|uniref:DUF6534 domain-containing protein n=1 Tax=Armillaria solidipes TaxID=1076256 RepID=A0A2H3AIK5_9AGAR|nr:hypothetical protein ARMSODRAFT_983522 [Armillaria solidipes]
MLPVSAGYPIERLSGPMVRESSNFCLEYIQFTNTAIQIVASLLHWGLFGTLSAQLSFPNDRKFTKYLVYGVYVVEFAQTILVSHDIFAVFWYGFGDLEAVTEMRFNWLTVPVMSAAGYLTRIQLLVSEQVFYAYRIFILSKSRTVPIFVTCVSLMSSMAAIITGVFSFQAGNITKLNNRKTSVAVRIWCGGSALCDVVIAICMTYHLMRSNSGFRRTRIIVTKLIRLTIETGSVTAVVALLSLILFFALPDQSFYKARLSHSPKPERFSTHSNKARVWKGKNKEFLHIST